MKLKPSVGCHSLLAAVIATLATVAQLFAANPAVTISWSNPADIVYGTALSSSQLNATFSTSTGGAVEGTASYEPQLGTYLPAGSAQTLKVTWVPKDTNQGVAASTATVSINVAKAPLTATIKNVSAVYGSALTTANNIVANPTANVTYAGFVRNEDSGQITASPTIQFPSSLSNSSDAGTAWALSFATKPAASNYNITTVNGTLSVGQKPLVFTLANPANIEFGSTPVAGRKLVLATATDNGPFGATSGSDLQGRGIGWVGSDLSDANIEINHVHSVSKSSNAGAYDISVVLNEKKPGLLSNYDITINNGTYTVDKRDLQVTMTSVSDIVYGAAIPASQPRITMVNPTTWDLTDNFDSSKDATKLAGYDKVLTSPIVVTYPAANSGVKRNDGGTIISYDIVPSGGAFYGDNFDVTYLKTSFKINPTTLNIAASDRVKITGSTLPTLGVEFPDSKEFKHGDTPESVFKVWPPKLKYLNTVEGKKYNTANPPQLVGTGKYITTSDNGVATAEGIYQNAITFDGAPGGGSQAGNYTIVTADGDLTVTLQPIQFTWAPTSTILTYGDMISSTAHLNAVSASSVVVNGTSTSVPVTTVYTLVDKNGAAITTGNNGGTLVGGTVNSEGTLVGGTVAKAAEAINAGTFYIKATVSVNQTLVNANSALAAAIPQYGDATETIAFSLAKKSLEVSADNQTRKYNEAGSVSTKPKFDVTDITYKSTDFVSGESESDITANGGSHPTVTDPTTLTSNIGDYSIIPSGGKDENYAFVFKAGTLKVTAADAPAITWNPDAAVVTETTDKKHITYGTSLDSVAEKNLQHTVSPAIDGTWSYNVSTSNPTALTYPWVEVKATFTPSSNNYKAGSATRKIYVKRRDVDVEPDAKTAVYGDAIPALTGTADFIESDGITTTFQTGAVLGSPVGTYSISAKFNDSKGRLKNYNVKLASDSADNSLKITPAVLSITAQNASSKVDGAQSTLELSFSGLKAEAAVLNGIALSLAEVSNAYSSTNVTYSYVDGSSTKTSTVDNSKSGLDASIVTNKLLENVFKTSSDLPTLTISPAFDSSKEATFAIKVGLTQDSDKNIIALKSNYTVGTLTDGEYGVGKINATFTLAGKGGSTALTYGSKLTSDLIVPTLTDPTEPSDKKGTWSYSVNGEAVNGQILAAGKHKVQVTYTPHSSEANAYVPTTNSIEFTVNKAPLTIAVKSIGDYIYGDPLPYIQTVNYVYGTGTGNKDNNFVNGESSAVFTQQPVVIIRPKVVDSKPTDYSVANSAATIEFVQEPKAANYNITAVDGSLTINRRPVTVKPVDETIPYGGTAALALEYANMAVGETGADLENAGFTYLSGGQDTSVLEPGTYTIYSGGAYGANYVTTHVTGTLTVSKKPAEITISGASAVYDGTAHSVTVTTVPAGLSTSVTYDGSATAPTDAGTYEVVVTVNDGNHSGEVTGSLTISPAPVEITLSKLAAKYNGSAKSAKAVSSPSVDIAITYDGKSDAPSAVGSYAVVATPSDANYSGEVTGTLVIDKGTAFILPSDVAQMADGTAKTLTIATEPSGLDTTVVYTQINPAIDAILLDFGNEGATASGTPGSPWQGFNELVVDEAYDLGNGITMTAQGDGFSPNNPAGSGSAVDYDGITVPVAARDDYLFKTDDTPGGTAKLVFNGLPAGVYNVTMFEGRTTDVNQVAKLWAGGNRDEPVEANVASFAGGGTTVEVTVAEGDTLYYLHMEDGSGGISGMIIRNVSRPDTAVDAPVEPGIYSAVITVVDDNYQGSLSTALGIIPGATISFESLSSAYTGSANPVSVVTDPAGLNVSVTYSKNPNAPVAPGTYPVVATIVDDVYSGTISGDYVIESAPATVAITNLKQPFNSVVAPSVATTPAGLATVTTYNGGVELPTQPGEYEVVVTIVDDIYSGSGTATLSLGKGGQTIDFPAIPNLSINGVALALVLNASSSSGLPVAYNVLEGGATLVDNILTINQPGVVTIVAQQLGNEVYAAAEEKSRFFNVTGTGIPLGAAQSVASLDDDGNLSVSTSGQPFQQMSVYKAGEANGEFTPILKVMLDENGQSTFKTETSGDQGYFQVK